MPGALVSSTAPGGGLAGVVSGSTAADKGKGLIDQGLSLIYVFWLTAGIRSDRPDPIWSLAVMASRSGAKLLHAATSRLNSLFSLSEACRPAYFRDPNGHVLDLLRRPGHLASGAGVKAVPAFGKECIGNLLPWSRQLARLLLYLMPPPSLLNVLLAVSFLYAVAAAHPPLSSVDFFEHHRCYDRRPDRRRPFVSGLKRVQSTLLPIGYFSALVEHRLGMACDLGIEIVATRRGGRDYDG
jgi:hypothetical protein